MTDDQKSEGARMAAQMVVPPNKLKEKAGSGGFDESIVAKAQDEIKNNKVDFRPIAAELVAQLDKAVTEARSGRITGDASMREIMVPAMQLKAQGSMFHYPLVSDIGNILVNFLETVPEIDADVLEIITAHKASITAALSGKIPEKDRGKVGKQLCSALVESCERYAKSRKAS
jgi:hypothetical protein